MNSKPYPRSLPGLTPKSGVPDFGGFQITKVGNIRLWLQSIFLRKGWTRQNSGVPEFFHLTWTQIGNVRFAVVKLAGDALNFFYAALLTCSFANPAVDA
jgi:hypothetical protein